MALPNVVPWSYTSLTGFETCPRRYYITRIAKEIVEPQSQAMIHGNEVHKAIEQDLKGERALPEKYAQYGPMLTKVKMVPGKRLVEQKVGLTKSYQPTTFFAKDVWVRGVLDLALVNTDTAVVLDWKTGKPKSDSDQLKLFAGMAFAMYPYVNTVKTGFAWLAHDKLDTAKFTRDDVPIIWREFNNRVARMENAQESGDYPPKPSGLCRSWCPVGNNRCEFCGV